jgi:hypothetical protein
MSEIIEFKPRGGGQAGPQEPGQSRWRADIEYRSEEGGQLVTHYIEEIEDLQDLIELGPHFDAIVKCVITVNRQSGEIPRLTKEQADIL